MAHSALKNNTVFTDAAPIRMDLKKMTNAVNNLSLKQSEPVCISTRLPCGHCLPCHYLTAWAQYQLEEKHTDFSCPRFSKPHQRVCGAAFSYQTVCDLVPLDLKKQQYFEETISALAALNLCDYMKCPGCLSYVERADPSNLCVHCSICTSKMGRSYQFCWQCQREWKGPHVNVQHCANVGCGQKVSPPESTSALKLCQPEFKSQMLRSEKDDIYMSLDKSDRRRRMALLINNVEFENVSDRSGAEIDERSMKTLLESLGYTVVTLRNLTSEGMQAALEDFSQRKEHSQSDSCFVVIMSHGTQGGMCGVLCGDDEEDILSVDSIFNSFNTPNCPALRDKPKVILIQACRGGEDGGVWVTDSVPRFGPRKEHREKDFICLRSCTPDTVSYRNTKRGSEFIQTVVKTFNEHAHKDHIDKLFRKVQRTFKDNFPDQMPCRDRTTLVKRFYLFPGL